MAADNLKLRFNGSNWEDLDRIIALSRFQFFQSSEYDDDDLRKCAYLATQFEGPALDWAVNTHSTSAATFQDFDGFVVACKQAFGVEDTGITALRRQALDDLKWSRDVPVFFSEFDRLTLQLNITDHGTKIVMVRAKLPTTILKLLAEQALDFANYETMRERLITMWALDPTPGGRGPSSAAPKKPRCGSCGKKGHTASNCRGGSKN